MSRHIRGQSGPHSIHDARQHAWAQLMFGPGAPPPRQRLHPGLLPDVYVPAAPLRRSLLSRLIRLLRGRRNVEREDAADEFETLRSKDEDQPRPQDPQAHDRNDSLAA
ncbi:MAG: hypothetical protein KF849_07350 [Rhizobiaceae bacterium]|nr:hypothetical protein [Rhizobiaceae bacterium]